MTYEPTHTLAVFIKLNILILKCKRCLAWTPCSCSIAFSLQKNSKMNVAILANPEVINHGRYINFQNCIIEMHN